MDNLWREFFKGTLMTEEKECGGLSKDGEMTCIVMPRQTIQPNPITLIQPPHPRSFSGFFPYSVVSVSCPVLSDPISNTAICKYSVHDSASV